MATLLGECHPVSSLSDDELIQLSRGDMPPAEDQRLSVLLGRQQARTLAPGEEDELSALMCVYGASLVRQAEALAESVRRGLREPLCDHWALGDGDGSAPRDLTISP